MRFILGSQSPRRKEILSFFSVPFVQIPSSFEEEGVPFRGNPSEYALTLSMAKANVLGQQFPNDLILTADTVVYLEKEIYNKPKNAQEAFSMLKAFSGKWQQVYTALTVQRSDQVHSGCEETRLLFNPLTEEQIQLYHHSCNFLDKAGSYAIQQTGSMLISRIDGCYYNVMGLPVNLLKELLGKFNIDLWHYLRPS